MKYKNLLVILILIIVWSLFFAIYKYYIWGIFKTDTITLQYISGYLSLGTISAFIVGGLLYELFGEKKYHLLIISSSLFLLLNIYFVHTFFVDYLFVASLTLFIGFFYGLWGVLRNILISSEIHESSLSDTQINALANIAFITSIIIGSIVGGKIAESLNLNGIFVISFLLVIGLYIGRLLTNKNIKEDKSIKDKIIKYKNNYILDLKFIIKKYLRVMVFIALIITIATILSQKAIEYNVNILGKNGSNAAFILLYSAVGSIIGNLLSMKINNHRWLYFMVLSGFFSITICLFPTFIDSFTNTSILAFIAGVFFGIVYNLLEVNFFKSIAIDDKKSFGSVSLGLITSIIVSGLMFLVDTIEKISSFAGVYYFMGSIIIIIGISTFIMRNKLD